MANEIDNSRTFRNPETGHMAVVTRFTNTYFTAEWTETIFGRDKKFSAEGNPGEIGARMQLFGFTELVERG